MGIQQGKNNAVNRIRPTGKKHCKNQHTGHSYDGHYLSISPKTTSIVPMIAATSAS